MTRAEEALGDGVQRTTQKSCLHPRVGRPGYTSCANAGCDGAPNVYRWVILDQDGKVVEFGDWLPLEADR